MKTSVTCPACKFQIPLWRVMIAPTPYSIMCNSCLSTIRVRMGCVTGMILLFAFVFIAASAAALMPNGCFCR